MFIDISMVPPARNLVSTCCLTYASCGTQSRTRRHNRNIKGLTPKTLKLSLLDESGMEQDFLCDVLAPYEVLHWLHKAGHVNSSLLSTTVSPQEYWSVLLSQPWAANHPLQGKPHLWPLTIPIVYFTDGAEVSKASSSEGFTCCVHAGV